MIFDYLSLEEVLLIIKIIISILRTMTETTRLTELSKAEILQYKEEGNSCFFLQLQEKFIIFQNETKESSKITIFTLI